MPMPTDIKQLCSLIDGLNYYRKFLPNMARHIRPITALLKESVARNGGYRSCPSRGTRSTPNTCLPGLGRGHRHVSALLPPLRRQHRWPRSHPRTRTAGWLHTPHRLASTNSTPSPPDLQSDPPPPTAPLHSTTPEVDVQAAAAHLSNTLPNYSHND